MALNLYVWGDKAALYDEEGNLAASGTPPEMIDAAFAAAGVIVTTSDHFLLGGNTPAATLDEVLAYTADRQDKEMRAAALRAHAQQLIEKAEQLESELWGA